MEELQLICIPETIEQAVETLTIFYAEHLQVIHQMSEKEFKASSHYGAGMFIRSTWYLWWYEGHHYVHWSKEKPIPAEYLD